MASNENGLLPDLTQPGALVVPALNAQPGPVADVPFGWKQRVDDAVGSPTGAPAQPQITSSADIPLPSTPMPAGTPDDAIRDRVLSHISSGEAHGYNVLYDGGTFNDYSKFPQWSGKQGPAGISHAAGFLQIQPGTWKRILANNPDIKDFSPESQKKGGWWLAQSDYKAATGRDLLSDAKAGNVNWGALGNTWSSLKGKGRGAVPEGSLPTAGGTEEHSGGSGGIGSPLASNDPSASASSPPGLNPKTLRTLMTLSIIQPMLQFHPVDYDPFKIQQLGVSNG